MCQFVLIGLGLTVPLAYTLGPKFVPYYIKLSMFYISLLVRKYVIDFSFNFTLIMFISSLDNVKIFIKFLTSNQYKLSNGNS